MRKALRTSIIAGTVLSLSYPLIQIQAKGGKSVPEAPVIEKGPAVLWREPDIAARDLYYGSGGKAHEPKGTFTFVGEDPSGSSPKFEIIGEDGIKWKAKLGLEARPETAASRLVWAAGYFANEVYFVPELHVRNMPHLRRGSSYVSPDGTVRGVRLKRQSRDEKKAGGWEWGKNPFTGKQEFYGLRTLMAVINNWDLKDSNNAIYEVTGDNPEQRYVVGDLGASFGTTNLDRGAKGDLQSYERSKWINSVSDNHVDFNVPSAPGFGYTFAVPIMVRRMSLVWIGHGIPRSDARWMGNLLARLSAQQIRDAFRAAGYSAEEGEAFSRVLERRIAELKKL